MNPASNPYGLVFDFSAISATLGSNISTVNVLTPGDFLAYGLATYNSSMGGYAIYRIEFQLKRDYLRLTNSEFSMGTFQSDARTLWRLPCPWFLPANTMVTLQLRNMTYQSFVPTAVTTQHVLLGTLFPAGLPRDCVPCKTPYGFSFFYNLGFNEDTTSGGNVTDTYNLYPSFKKSLPPLDWDFELKSICIDALNMLSGDRAARFHKLRIFDRKTKAELYRTPSTLGNVAGCRATDSFSAANLSVPTGFPTNNVLQYELAEPVIFRRGTNLSVQLALSFLYGSASFEVSNLNGECNVLLLGNKLEKINYAA